MSIRLLFIIIALIGAVVFFLGIKLKKLRPLLIIVGVVVFIFGAYGVFTSFL